MATAAQGDDAIVLGSDGLYAVCFKNFKGRSKEEITEVFEKYGKVESVRFAGGETGMTFIRYQEYDDVKHCLEDMRKTSEFNVRVARPRDNNNGNKFRYQNNGPRNFQRDSNVNSASGFSDKSHQKYDQKGKGNFPRRSMQNRDEENQDLDNKNRRFRRDSDTKSQKSNSSGQHNDTANEGPPPLVNLEDELPPLLDTRDMPPLVEKHRKIKAVDVLLANFPFRTSEMELYYFLRECDINVLAITDLEVTGIKYNIPYCHVWLESLYEANVAEAKLNGLRYRGRKLVSVKTQTVLASK